jgi:hypothetical protein
MARALGISHTLVNKVVADQQLPGRRFLAAITTALDVNSGWLLTGVGEALRGKRNEVPRDGWPVPISRVLLPGPLDEHRDLLTNEVHLVAGVQYNASAYVLELQPESPLVFDSTHAMQAGDRILLNTDPQTWEKNIGLLNNRYCVVRFETPIGPYLDLSRVVCCFSEAGAWELRAAINVKPLGGHPWPPSPKGYSGEGQIITADAVVAVAVGLFRHL